MRPNPNEHYRHYKGNHYVVLSVGRHTETMEEMVVYVDETDPKKIWIRPLSMWEETVSTKDGIVNRFQKMKKTS